LTCHVYTFDSEYRRLQEGMSSRGKRATATPFTMEVSIYLDEVFWALLENSFNAFTTEQKISMVALKWNGVSVKVMFISSRQNTRRTVKSYPGIPYHYPMINACSTDKSQMFQSRTVCHRVITVKIKYRHVKRISIFYHELKYFYIYN